MIDEVDEETELFEFSREELEHAAEVCSSLDWDTSNSLGQEYWCELFEYDLDELEARCCSPQYRPQPVPEVAP